MDIFVKNKSFETVGLIDVFESFIWTDRYFEAGEFELYTSVTKELLTLLQEDYYLQIKDSDRTMIIESIQIKTDVEQGNKLVVTGRSLESILDRRVIFSQIQYEDVSIQTIVQDVLNKCFIGPVQPPFLDNRITPNMVFELSSSPAVTNPIATVQYRSNYVYDVVRDICKTNSIGFRVTLNASNQFVVKLYSGVDRSYSQTTNPFVVFSPNFDNLMNSDYYRSKRNFKTARQIIGDSSDGVFVAAYGWIFGGNTYFGIDHREGLVDLSNLSKFEEGTSTPIEYWLYQSQLNALSNMIHHQLYDIVENFDGQVNTVNNFKYLEDFFLGDIVQIENEYGLKGRSRIVEVIITENQNGVYVYPTFEAL